MPTYDGADYLRATLESLVAQAMDDVEVIVVDDGSRDATVDVARSYSDRLQLRLLEPGHTGNWVANTNLGLAVARGHYAGVLHQDDAWAPQRLRILRPLLDQAPHLDLVFHAVRYIDASGRPVGLLRSPLPPGVDLGCQTLAPRLLVQNFISLPSALFRRGAAERVHGLDEALTYTADWDLWLKLAAGGTARYLASPLADFRVHAGSLTARMSGQAGALRHQLDAVIQRHLHLLGAGAQRDEVERAARFSIDANVALGGALHGHWGNLARLAGPLVRLGPAGCRRYLRDSRITERSVSRIRANMRPERSPGGTTG